MKSTMLIGPLEVSPMMLNGFNLSNSDDLTFPLVDVAKVPLQIMQ